MEVYRLHIVHLISLFFLLFLHHTSVVAQNTKCWTFDNEGSYNYEDLQSGSLQHTEGVSQQAIKLNATKEQFLTLPFEPTERQAFSVSFWFRLNDDGNYMLLQQIQTEEQETQQYIEIGINKNAIYRKNSLVDKILIERDNNYSDYLAKKWHFLTYTFDGETTYQLYVDTSFVWTTNMQTLSTKRPKRTNGIVIGKGKKSKAYFNGAIDELRIDTAVLSLEEIKKRYEEYAPKKISTLLDSLKTNQNFLGLELWNTLEDVKSSEISLRINEADSIINVLLDKNKKEKVIVPIINDSDNRVTFFINNLKESDNQIFKLNVYELDNHKNRISDIPMHKKPFTLLCNKDTSRYLKIKHESKLTKETINIGTTSAKKLELQLSCKDKCNMLQYITIDDTIGSTFRIVEDKDAKKELTHKDIIMNRLTYLLELKEQATNNIPIKIGFLNNVSIEPLEIKVFDAVKKDTIYVETFYFTNSYHVDKEKKYFKNNHHVYLNVKHKQAENETQIEEKKGELEKQGLPKKQFEPEEKQGELEEIQIIHLGTWQDADKITLKISDRGKQRNTLLNIELDGKLIAKNVSLEMTRNIPLTKLGEGSDLRIIPVKMNPLSKVSAKIICKKQKNKEDFSLHFEKEKPTHIQFKY